MTAAEILALIEGAAQILGVVDRQITAARARGEWTEEQDRAFAAKLKAVATQPHWRSKPAPPPAV